MAHYICTGGCEGISEKKGVCTTEDCKNQTLPLEECNCIDGKHHGAFDVLPEVEEDE